ncbi:MAG TPA: molybdate ABC transporter substrate-binding protein [Gaiellales bacterium]|nr:molybdate ABC transporter substrate-binding protein [Gaiellales bacterium]
MRRRSLLPTLLAVIAVAAGCGGSSSSSGGGSAGAGGGTLTVFAASSLTDAFTKLATTFQQQHPGWKVRFEFLGSDQLAAQIEQGDPADVFAAASTKYPEQLQGAKLLGPTKNFATNTLVLAVPPDNPAHITSVHNLGNAKLIVGDPAVPVGSYTLQVLGNLGIDPKDLNIVSQEQKTTDIVSKLELGEGDAGFIYTSDATTAGDKLKSIALPAKAQATATYPIGIVTGSKNAKAAQQWIDLVLSSTGQQVLTGDGFGPAPSTS